MWTPARRMFLFFFPPVARTGSVSVACFVFAARRMDIMGRGGTCTALPFRLIRLFT